MTLTQLFSALTNTSALITVQDNDGSELVKVIASGHEQLLAALLARTVDQITVQSNAAITVKLAENS